MIDAATRQRLLAAALMATLVAAWFAPEAEDDHGTAAAALAPMPTLLEWPQPPELPAITRIADAVPLPDRGRTAKAAPSGKEEHSKAGHDAGPPNMPAPPFRMFGRIERDGEVLAFFAHAGRTLTAAAGDRLPGDWQVDVIGSDGAHLTYLPLGQTVRIPFKAPSQ